MLEGICSSKGYHRHGNLAEQGPLIAILMYATGRNLFPLRNTNIHRAHKRP
jgi:hypothetical protein